ncbi:ROK family transcriptional regulator [soil metagenome]
MARRESSIGPGSRALVVDHIRSAGPVSRADLAVATGLTQPSISNIVRRLLVERIVVEDGKTTVGTRPSKLLSINAYALYAIGMHVSDAEVTCVATDMNAGMVARQRTSRTAGNSERLSSELVDVYGQFVHLLGTDEMEIAGLSVVVPSGARSRVDLGSLRLELERSIGHKVLVEHAALAATMGEYWSRQISREESLACVFIDESIESGIVLGGGPWRGSRNSAGRLGHISIDRNGPVCECGSRGCLDLYASPRAIVNAARAIPKLSTGLDLRLERATISDDFDLIGRAAVNGHPEASSLFGRAAQDLGQAVVSMNALVDLSSIVVTGPASAVPGSLFVRAIRESLNSAGAGILAGNVSLSESPRDSAAIGAAAMVLQSSVSPGHYTALGSTRLASASA